MLPVERRAAIGAAARRRVIAEYSLPAIAMRYRNLYEKVRTMRQTSGSLRPVVPGP
jgi:hypothetical protein